MAGPSTFRQEAILLQNAWRSCHDAAILRVANVATLTRAWRSGKIRPRSGERSYEKIIGSESRATIVKQSLFLSLLAFWFPQSISAQQSVSSDRSKLPAVISALVVSPDGQVITGSQAGLQVRSTGGEVTALDTQLDHVTALAFSPQGNMLAVGGGSPAVSGSVELWSWPRAELVARVASHEDLVTDIAWHPVQHSLLVTASADRTVAVWQIDNGQNVKILRAHSDQVLALAISEDGKWLCSAGVDQTIRVWNTQTWQLRRTLNNHLGTVHDLEFRPSGSQGRRVELTSSSEDRTVRTWYPDIGRMVRIVRYESPVLSVAWNADGASLFTGDKNGQIHTLTGEFRQPELLSSLSDCWVTEILVKEPDQLLAGTTTGRVETLDWPNE